jgi:hypothetical protein
VTSSGARGLEDSNSRKASTKSNTCLSGVLSTMLGMGGVLSYGVMFG